MICKRCEEEFTPTKGFVNYCSTKCRFSPNSAVAGWNNGIPQSTGNHYGSNNSIHKMDPAKRLRMNREKLVLARQVIEENKEEIAQKKSDAMHRLMDKGYKPQDNAGWGGGGRPRSAHLIEHMGAMVSPELKERLDPMKQGKESHGLCR